MNERACAVYAPRVHVCECDPIIFKAVEPHLSWVETLVPGWVQDVYVMCRDEDGPSARATVEQEYRRIWLTFYRPFMTEPNQMRVMIHELMHCYTTPIKRVAHEFADDAFPEAGPAVNTFLKRLDDATEGATCDLEEFVSMVNARMGKRGWATEVQEGK